MRIARVGIESAFALAVLAGISVFSPSRVLAVPVDQQGSAEVDIQIQTDLARSLDRFRFKNVEVSVSRGIITLSGTVNLFSDKEEAVKKAHRTKHATAVRNEIQVGGPQVPDQELQRKLVRKVEYDRVGYGTTTFNAISVHVSDGVVTLGGHAYGTSDKHSALSIASDTPGVRDVIDEIDVDPVSPMDDRVRLLVARAVYGYASLTKYAIDPGKPIRISVQNGNVTLFGVVDTKADSDTAYVRANGVPGVFKVTNNLQIADNSEERE